MGLRTLRLVYLAFVLWPLITLVLAVWVVPGSQPSGETVPLIVLGLYTAGVVGFAAWGWSRPLKTDSETMLAESFRTRFFFRLALAESPSLMGFVMFLITGSLWPYVLSLMVTAALLALAAPTERRIDLAQQEVVAKGSALSLREALDRHRS